MVDNSLKIGREHVIAYTAKDQVEDVERNYNHGLHAGRDSTPVEQSLMM